MQWTSALAIYLLFWVMTAFFVLPFHGRRADETASPIAGSDPGAPAAFPVSTIIKQTTAVATVAFAAYYLFYVQVMTG